MGSNERARLVSNPLNMISQSNGVKIRYRMWMTCSGSIRCRSTRDRTGRKADYGGSRAMVEYVEDLYH